jgi:hypothetical protein
MKTAAQDTDYPAFVQEATRHAIDRPIPEGSVDNPPQAHNANVQRRLAIHGHTRQPAGAMSQQSERRPQDGARRVPNWPGSAHESHPV